jgi:hypothetical protein
MEENDYVKLTMMQVKGVESVEVDVLASRDTLTNMIYSAMCNNHFFANAVLFATEQYYLYVREHDERAKLN